MKKSVYKMIEKEKKYAMAKLDAVSTMSKNVIKVCKAVGNYHK